MTRCVVSIAQMKLLDMRIIINYLIVTKGKYLMGMCVSEVVVVDQRDDKETENHNILPEFSFFKSRQLLEYKNVQK